jgi:hypothetical protein
MSYVVFYSADVSIRANFPELDERLAANGQGAEDSGHQGLVDKLVVAAGNRPTTNPEPVHRGYRCRLAAPFEF